MEKFFKLIALCCLIGLVVVPVALADDASMDQIDSLKTQISKYEKESMNKPSSMAGTEGLMIGGGATFVIQSTQDANATSYEGEDVTDSTYTVDINLAKEVGDKGKVFVDLEAGNGAGLDGEELSLFSGVNYDAADYDDGIKVTQVGYQQSLMDEKVTVILGKLDSTLYFDENAVANNEKTQFLADAFRNSTAIEFPNGRYVMGGVVALQATEMVELKGGMFEDDSDQEDTFNDNLFFLQAKVSPEIMGNEGNYRVYGWYDTSSHVKLNDPSMKNEKNYGFGLSCDQAITDKITGFARVGSAKSELSTLELAWSLGADVVCPVYPDNKFGIAVGQNKPSDKYGDLGNPDAKETQMELYYNIKVNEAVSISPDLQVAWNPRGVKENSQGRNDTVVVAGLRAQLDF